MTYCQPLRTRTRRLSSSNRKAMVPMGVVSEAFSGFRGGRVEKANRERERERERERDPMKIDSSTVGGASAIHQR